MVARMTPFHLTPSSIDNRESPPAPRANPGSPESPPIDASPGIPVNSPTAYPRASRSPETLRSPLNDSRKWSSYKDALLNKESKLTFMNDDGVIMEHDFSTMTTTYDDDDDFILVTKKKRSKTKRSGRRHMYSCLLYTSDAADE